MLKNEYTLSDVVDYFKENHINSFEEDIDFFGDNFITAARIAAVIVAPNAITALSNFCGGIDAASLKVSKLFSWLPDKFKYRNKGRDIIAIERYELSSIIYIKLLDLAIENAVYEILVPLLKDSLNSIEFDEEEKNEIERMAKEAKQRQLSISIDTFSLIDEGKIKDIVNSITEPLLPCLYRIKSDNRDQKSREEEKGSKEKLIKAIEDTKGNLIKKSYFYFNVFILHFASEFPEFNLWFDYNTKKEIMEIIRLQKQQKQQNQQLIDSFTKLENSIEKALKNIDNLNKDSFAKKEGFPSFENTFETIFKIQTDNIVNRIDEKFDESKRECIKSHHNFIKGEVEKRLSDDETIDEIVYPKNREIYIAQGYSTLDYKRKDHKKSFLTIKGFDENSKKGEDIGLFLLKKLIDPNTTNNPIIILGNPGAGKSIFSKHFAEELCNTSDFVPFLIRLRDVASSSTNVSEHINKGIVQSFGYNKEIEWLDLAKLFKQRIPVIILDGFDELMQSSGIELNNYIVAIKELQGKAYTNGICLKVILTSRIAVMQDVSIPDGTTILKLNPFDAQRKELWIKKWNSFQTKKGYKLKLPDHKEIKELSQEPLLLFMLAVYDFPDAKLLSITSDVSFNQSHLYDSLLTDFGKRQLKKEDTYKDLGEDEEKKGKEEELFRLRLGMIALLMFLNDSTNKDIKRLGEELRVCKLDYSEIKPRDVLTGFFFVHQNKSTEDSGHENFNYEFLHKSFGEFLAADFMLRIANKLNDAKTKNKLLFQFCFGYNWLNKHPEIQKFMFEHAYSIFDLKQNAQERVIEEIRDSLSNLFDSTLNDFPIPHFTIIDPKSKIEHLAIYSQNLIFLWLSLSQPTQDIIFDISPSNPSKDSIGGKEEKFPYLAQDREEINQEKLFWKRICNLWQLVGNYQSVAKLYEWIDVKEEIDKITLRKRKRKNEITNNLSQSSLVACNDFTFILSLFDAENKIENNTIISKIKYIYQQKPELTSLGNDSLLFRLEINSEKQLFDFLIEQDLNKRQLSILNERFISFGHCYSAEELSDSANRLLKKNKENRIGRWQIKLLNYLYNRVDFPSHKSSFLYESSRIFFNEFGLEFEYNEMPPSDMVEYITLLDNICGEFQTVWNSRRFHEGVVNTIHRAIQQNPIVGIEFINVISKSNRFELIYHIFPHGFYESIFDKLFSDKNFLDSDNIIYMLDCLVLISELNVDFIVKSDILRKILRENFEKILYHPNIEYLLDENPMFVLKYIKAVKKIHTHTNLIDIDILKKFSINIFNQITERNTLFSGGIDAFFNKRTFSHYGVGFYMQIINELSDFLPKEEIYHSKFIKLLMYDNKNSDFGRISYENPLLSIEYLKFLINFDINIETKNLLRYIERGLLEYLHQGRKDNTVFLEILKTINRANEVLMHNYLGELLDEVIRFMRKNKEYIRETPDIALESINILSNYGQPKIVYDIFPEFKYISKSGKELLYLQTFFNIFKK
jgi:hypothetical protein